MSKVLLLEPDRALTRIYAAALEYAGHQVCGVQSGQEAIEALETFRAGVIILELQLAGHGGIEFLHELRSYPEWQPVPVIVNTNLTPAALAPLRQTLLDDAGVVCCLYKPQASLRRLIRLVAKHAPAVGQVTP